jgi:hypothetical protein
MKVGAIRTRVAAVVALVVLVVLAGRPDAARAQGRAPATPAEMVASYDALADAILGANKAERKLVYAILAATYGHAQTALARARTALKANDAAGARSAIEDLAAAVGQLGTEGDNAVAGVRKRLLEGGHHANATGEAQGVYDEGYVVVTKAAKQAFLGSSKALAMQAREPKSEALESEWRNVEAAWAKHIAPAR